MKYIYKNLIIYILFVFFTSSAIAQQEAGTNSQTRSDSIYKSVEVAFRTMDEKDLMGGVSVLDVENIVKKAYHTNNNFMESMLGGHNSGLWGLGEYLVVIDGMVRDMNNVRPSEIKQITLLKGVNAVALYGSRAAKGVIQITTKRGSVGAPKLTVRANTGAIVPKAVPNYLKSSDYMILYNEARRNDGLDPSYSEEDIYNHASGNNPYRYPDLDMYSSEYLKKAANLSEALIEVDGGNDQVQYYTSAGYFREGSLLKVGNHSKDYVSRLFVRGNLDLQIAKFLKVQTDANVTYYDAYNARGDWWDNAATLRPNRVAPLIPIDYIEAGDDPTWNVINNSNYVIKNKYFLGGTQLDSTNPIADAYAAGDDKFVSRQFQFNTKFDFDLGGLTKGLHFRSKYGIDYASTYMQGYHNEYATYEPVWTDYAGKDLIGSVNKYNDDKKTGDEVIDGSAYRYTYNISGQFDYDRTFDDSHNVFAMVVANLWQTQISGEYHRLTNFNLGAQVSYNFQQKYYVDFSSALPYSAKLPEGNRMGFSPTVTLAWRPTNESFFDNTIFDDLFLSVSGGIINQDMDIMTDDNEMGYFLYKSILQRGGWYSWADLGGEAATEFQRGDNPNLTFIKRKEINIGLRGSLLNRLMVFDFNYFKGTMDGDIARVSSLYPIYFTQTGYPTSSIIPYVNYNIDNRSGFDFSAQFNKSIDKVDLSLGVVGTYFDTKAEKRDENFEYDYQTRIGRPINGLWGLENLGFFDSQDDIDNSPTQQFGETKPGDIKYKDQNGDGIIDANDEVYLGRWDTPFRLGLNFTAKWKNFTLFARADGFYGGSGFKNNSYYWVRSDNKYSDIVLDRWTEETKDVAKYPRLTTTSGDNNFRNSDFWMYKADRINLSQVQLTYDFSPSVLQNSFISDLSIYLGGYNLLTISKEKKHFEMNVGSAPQTRLYNIGIVGTF